MSSLVDQAKIPAEFEMRNFPRILNSALRLSNVPIMMFMSTFFPLIRATQVVPAHPRQSDQNGCAEASAGRMENVKCPIPTTPA